MVKTSIAPSISRESYAEIRQLVGSDGGLPSTYEEWFFNIATANAQRRSQGYSVVEVPVEPEAFAQYCSKVGQDPSRSMLDAYAVSLASR